MASTTSGTAHQGVAHVYPPGHYVYIDPSRLCGPPPAASEPAVEGPPGVRPRAAHRELGLLWPAETPPPKSPADLLPYLTENGERRPDDAPLFSLSTGSRAARLITSRDAFVDTDTGTDGRFWHWIYMAAGEKAKSCFDHVIFVWQVAAPSPAEAYPAYCGATFVGNVWSPSGFVAIAPREAVADAVMAGPGIIEFMAVAPFTPAAFAPGDVAADLTDPGGIEVWTGAGREASDLDTRVEESFASSGELTPER